MSYITSGYSVSVKCDCGRECDFGGSDSPRAVWREVRRSGWAVDRKKFTAICPACAKKMAGAKRGGGEAQ